MAKGTVYRKREWVCRTCKRRVSKEQYAACKAAGHKVVTNVSPTFWIRYRRGGKNYFENTHETGKTKAQKILTDRQSRVDKGEDVSPEVGRLTFVIAAEGLTNDYAVHGKRSADTVEYRLRLHLTPFFTGYRMVNINADLINEYIGKRQAEGAANANINRELALLKRMFSLAIRAKKLLPAHRPYVQMLPERDRKTGASNVRKGFFEAEQLTSVLKHLPEEIRPIVEFAAVTGWRVQSEVLPLEWRNVDFAGGEVRLDAGTTKNGEPRTFPITTKLRIILEEQQKLSDALKARDVICPLVFHRDGKRIKTFRKAWKNACKAAGCPGRLVHDLRRTAVRHLVRTGIPERVAMELTGHKTRSVFERYNIVSESDRAVAKEKLDAAQA
jgi:integrase